MVEITAISSIVIIIASILGAMAGIGGGVIIRPALDALNFFDNPVITNMISAFAVLAVALTSVIKHTISKTKFNTEATFFLGLGAIIGGVGGQYLFSLLKDQSDRAVLTIVQSIGLIVLLIFVIIYMSFLKGKEKYSFHIKKWYLTLLIGLFLGLSSSFLGRGGPINVSFNHSDATTLKQRVINHLSYHCENNILYGIEKNALNLHCSSRQLQRILNDLEKDQQIVKIGKGKYQLLNFIDR